MIAKTIAGAILLTAILAHGYPSARQARGWAEPIHVGAQTIAPRHSRYIMIYGYLRDRHPESDSTIDVWSKTRKTTYHVAIQDRTVFKFHTTIIPRSHLTYNAYVIVSCN